MVSYNDVDRLSTPLLQQHSSRTERPEESELTRPHRSPRKVPHLHTRANLISTYMRKMTRPHEWKRRMEYVPKVWNQRRNLKLRQGENAAPTLEIDVDSVLCISLICDKSVTKLKFVIFQEKVLKVLKCYNFLWVQRRHNCSPAASFANCVMTVYTITLRSFDVPTRSLL